MPLLDNDVIDFSARLPWRMKIAGTRRKHILKEAVRDLLPPSILNRGKQGFGVPLSVWFRGELAGLFAEVLGSPRTRQRGYFEPAFVDRLVREHRTGKRDHNLRLWQLLVFELWHRRYLDSPLPAASPVHAAAR
jgi:asparagine synthase (glutamine-hydrolysing)